MTSPFTNIHPLLIFFTCFGLTGVGACFIVGMPAVGQLLVGMWGTVMGERVFSDMTGKESGTKVDDE
jgi:hypothetical protein